MQIFRSAQDNNSVLTRRGINANAPLLLPTSRSEYAGDDY